MIRSSICDMLGIKYPLFQGGMAWVSNSKLAAAVSEAGGLGVITAINSDAEAVRNEIRTLKSITDKPFALNIMLMAPNSDEIAKLAIEESVPVVITGAGNPSKHIKNWLEAGIKVIPVVPSVALAKMVVRSGACAVIAEGGESGGHVGETTTMCLIPQVCDAVDVPVIAAGGIADGRGFCAALMLGAEGVQIGTRFLVANECEIHPTYKEKILKATDISTIATGKRLGHPVRGIKTSFSKEYFRLEYTNISDEDLEKAGEGSYRRAVVDGDEKKGSFLAGQISGLIKKEQSAKEIIEEIFEEAESLLEAKCKWVK